MAADDAKAAVGVYLMLRGYVAVDSRSMVVTTPDLRQCNQPITNNR